MTIKIHAFPASPRGFKPLLVANHIGADYDFHLVDLTKGEQKSPEFTALNPNQKMPVLQDGELKLWESNAIAAYLAETHPDAKLSPSDPQGRADVVRWLFWESTTWDPACAMLVFENVAKRLLTGAEPDAEEVAKGNAKFHFAAAILEQQLEGRAFVGGDAISVADLALAAPLILAEQAQFPLEPYPEIRRWASAIMALPAWSRTLALLEQAA